MTQIAVINRSKADDADIVFAVEAMRIQIERDFGPAWLLEPQDLPSIAFYASEKDLPIVSGKAILCTFVDKLMPGHTEGAVAFHTDVAGLQFIQIAHRNAESDSLALSHEILEWLADPTAAAWTRLPVGLLGSWTHEATEVCDPCEADSYFIDVTVFGERRAIRVSDFCRPGYFNANGHRPLTFLDTIDEPFGLSRNGGGYRVLLNADNGRSQSTFASRLIDDDRAAETLDRKLTNPDSRLSRRLTPNRPVKEIS